MLFQNENSRFEMGEKLNVNTIFLALMTGKFSERESQYEGWRSFFNHVTFIIEKGYEKPEEIN